MYILRLLGCNFISNGCMCGWVEDNELAFSLNIA